MRRSHKQSAGREASHVQTTEQTGDGLRTGRHGGDRCGGGTATPAAINRTTPVKMYFVPAPRPSTRDVRPPVNPNGDITQVHNGAADVAGQHHDSAVVADIVQVAVGQVTPYLSWNPNSGGLDLRCAVDYGELKQDARIDVYWARGTSYESRIGDPVYSATVPAGTDLGTYTQNIPGNRLTDHPDGETHLVAVVSRPGCTGSPTWHWISARSCRTRTTPGSSVSSGRHAGGRPVPCDGDHCAGGDHGPRDGRQVSTDEAID
jgi:hypothetical protein